MMMVANYLDDVIYNDQSIQEELSNDKKNTLINKLELIIIIKKSKELWKLEKLKNHFEHNKKVLNGKTIIKGTRITPETIRNCVRKKLIENINREDIFEEVLKDYPSITKQDVIACLVDEIRNIKYYKILFSRKK